MGDALCRRSRVGPFGFGFLVRELVFVLLKFLFKLGQLRDFGLKLLAFLVQRLQRICGCRELFPDRIPFALETADARELVQHFKLACNVVPKLADAALLVNFKGEIEVIDGNQFIRRRLVLVRDGSVVAANDFK